MLDSITLGLYDAVVFMLWMKKSKTLFKSVR
jgi:hypothetical protein